MKKWLFVLVLLALGVWFYTQPHLWSQVEEVAKPIMGTKPATLYRWRDERGVTQYTEDPPPAGKEYELIELDPDANVVPSFDGD